MGVDCGGELFSAASSHGLHVWVGIFCGEAAHKLPGWLLSVVATTELVTPSKLPDSQTACGGLN